MTAKEALGKIIHYDINDSGRCVNDYCEEECEVVAKALTSYDELVEEVMERQETEDSLTRWVAELTDEHNKLVKDVKRYFELADKGMLTMDKLSEEEKDFFELRAKLSKVGREE